MLPDGGREGIRWIAHWDFVSGGAQERISDHLCGLQGLLPSEAGGVRTCRVASYTQDWFQRCFLLIERNKVQVRS